MRYYLQKLTLPAAQLLKLALLWDQLHLQDECMQTLQQLVRPLWTAEIVPEIEAMVVWLLHNGSAGLQLCKDILADPRRGALCEIQVINPYVQHIRSHKSHKAHISCAYPMLSRAPWCMISRLGQVVLCMHCALDQVLAAHVHTKSL